MSTSTHPEVVAGRLSPISEDPLRLGAILLSTDLTFEGDAARLISPELAVLHVARIGFENPTRPEQLFAMAPDLARTASLLVPGGTLSAVAFACTAASVTIGNQAVARAVRQSLPGVPVITPSSAAIAGFKALGVRRVAILTPYVPETTELLVRYFAGEGPSVSRSACFALEDDRDMARVDDASIIEAACSLDGPEIDALFLSCTAMRGTGVIDRIEERIGKPVIASNQAICWALMRMGGLKGRPAGFGRLFDCAMPAEFADGISS